MIKNGRSVVRKWAILGAFVHGMVIGPVACVWTGFNPRDLSPTML